MDRNAEKGIIPNPKKVALRKESVDRNTPMTYIKEEINESLSARRAWIEIIVISPACRKLKSLSARRAWIEIRTPQNSSRKHPVALRKESVDRNYRETGGNDGYIRRSPQGERG